MRASIVRKDKKKRLKCLSVYKAAQKYQCWYCNQSGIRGVDLRICPPAFCNALQNQCNVTKRKLMSF